MTFPETLPSHIDAAVTAALTAYCRGVDRRDWDLVAAAFHEDAIDDHGVFAGPVDQLIAWMQERHGAITSSMHVLGQSYRHMTSDRSVAAETYCVVYQTHRGEAARQTTGTTLPDDHAASESPADVQVQVRCRYLDEVTLVDDVWRIARRTVIFESQQLEVGVPVPPGSGGTRDANDLSYVLLDGRSVPVRS